MADNRNLSIDCLRGISILVVMVGHGAAPLPQFVVHNTLLLQVVKNSFLGVHLFFVMSGFLITSHIVVRYAELGRVDLAQFYTMRVGRIFPCLAIFVAIFFVLNRYGVTGFTPANPDIFGFSLMGLITLQYNYSYLAGANVPGMSAFTPLWSLSIEECFYLIFPLLCFFGRRTWVITTCLVATFCFCSYFRTSIQDAYLFWGAADLIAAGCLAAIAVNQFDLKSIPLVASRGLVLAGAAGLFAVFAFLPNTTAFRTALPLVALFASMYLIGASSPQLSDRTSKLLFVLKPLAFMGKLSLSLYVFHIMVRDLVTLFGGHEMTTFLIVLPISYLLERFVLDPLNRSIRKTYASPKEIERSPFLATQNAPA